MNFSQNVDNDTRNRLLDFGGEPDHYLDPEFFMYVLSLHSYVNIEVVGEGVCSDSGLYQYLVYLLQISHSGLAESASAVSSTCHPSAI